MAKKLIYNYEFDASAKTIKVGGNYTVRKLILITNTTDGVIIYNFAEPSAGATVYYDTVTDKTTITLEYDTTSMSDGDELQILADDAGDTKIDAGESLVDPVHKFRVSNPQNLIDTDFEYGLQSSKWETIELVNNIPSVYTVNGGISLDSIQSVSTIASSYLNVENVSTSIEGELLFSKIDMNLVKGDKVLLYSKDSRATTSFFQIINEKLTADSGNYKWGITTNHSYLPLDNSEFFNKNISLVDWLRNWAKTEEEREEVYLRGFLGKMIFSGEEALKKCTVLSGGEKVRCMLSKMMMKKGNVLILDEPTNHLDLESITAFNNSLNKFKGTVLLSTHDHQFAQTISNRVIELTPNGVIDRYMKFDDYMSDDKIKELRNVMYKLS